jgi:anti-sigma regulatory factor (Ser/Thr protein kinase)
MASDHLALDLENKLSEIARMSSALEDFADRHQVPADVLVALNLALEELVTNTISYGYDDGATHTIRVGLQLEGDSLTAVVQDDGKPYNPFLHQDPDVGVSLEEREIGGLGVMLVRQLMDAVAYRRDGNQNIVTIAKRTSGGR